MTGTALDAVDPFVFRLSIFVLAVFVGYYVVWSVTPALHTPLMSVTNAISSVIVVGALLAVSIGLVVRDSSDLRGPRTLTYPSRLPLTQLDFIYARHLKATESSVPRGPIWARILGFFALILASVNIFGGFLVTERMLAMYKKKG